MQNATKAKIIYTNTTRSGSGFGVVQETGASCFIPKTVIHATNMQLYNIYTVFLVPNRTEGLSSPPKNVTPWMVAFVEPNSAVPTQLGAQLEMTLPPPAAPEPEPEEVAKRVRDRMREGGVWTVGDLFELLYPQYSRADNRRVYNSVSHALRGMYDKGECAKWTMVRNVEQERASRDWFSCHPDKVYLAYED